MAKHGKRMQFASVDTMASLRAAMRVRAQDLRAGTKEVLERTGFADVDAYLDAKIKDFLRRGGRRV